MAKRDMMGIGDKFNELKQKAQEVAGQHPDKVEQGLDRAGDFADKKTGGQHSEQIDKGVDLIERQIGEQEPPR